MIKVRDDLKDVVFWLKENIPNFSSFYGNKMAAGSLHGPSRSWISTALIIKNPRSEVFNFWAHFEPSYEISSQL